MEHNLTWLIIPAMLGFAWVFFTPIFFVATEKDE